MVCIDKRTYEIVNANEIINENYFECDELIAESVAMLNKKGYITKFSCSGHLYEDMAYVVADDEKQAFELQRDLERSMCVIKNENAQEPPYKVIWKEDALNSVNIVLDREYDIEKYFENSIFDVYTVEEFDNFISTPGQDTVFRNGVTLQNVQVTSVYRTRINYDLINPVGFNRIYEIVMAIQVLRDIISTMQPYEGGRV